MFLSVYMEIKVVYWEMKPGTDTLYVLKTILMTTIVLKLQNDVQTGGLALWVAIQVSWLVQPEISQQLSDGLPLSLLKTFMVSKG